MKILIFQTLRWSFIGLLLFSCVQENDQAYINEIQQFHNELNAQYANPEKSPLEKEDLKSFQSLDFFPIDKKFLVEAEYIRTANEKPFGMKTTTDRTPMYVKYAIVKFELDGKEFQLSVFQNLDLREREGYDDYLFLPFTDLTSGVESYGGGRYLDLFIPESNKLFIDFNKAYNPYCAYNYHYSCPVPPAENDLNIEIRAGVKDYKKI